MRQLKSVLVAFALLTAACGDSGGAVSTTNGLGPVGGGLESEIQQLVAAAEQVRGLEFVVDPVITIVDAGELADRVREQIEEDLQPDDVAVSQRLYEILGLLDGSVDLGQAYTDLYAEQVGGYYDNETGEMVIMGGSELSPLSKSIVIHELIHALTDQHYDFGAVVDQLWDEERFHAASAIQALAEGDATYYQLIYLQTLSTEEQVDAIQESLEVDTTVMDSLPPWFAEDLSFPYDFGFGFVQRLIAEGDAAAVNQAYELLPESTEQILHPEKYFIREPALEVEVPEIDVPGHELFEVGTFGEWNTRLFLLDGVDPGEAVVAAAGWGGDRYRLYWNGDLENPSVAFAIRFVMDTPRDAQELADSLALSAHRIMKVGSARSPVDGAVTFTGGEDFAYVAVDGESVVFIGADDAAAGQALVAGFGG